IGCAPRRAPTGSSRAGRRTTGRRSATGRSSPIPTVTRSSCRSARRSGSRSSRQRARSMPEKQTWDPARYERNARVVSDLGAPVVELLAPRPGERILDLGCGDGALTERLVAMGCDVVGVDGSAAQVDGARRRGLDARVADGEALSFEAEFDAVFSNAA